MIHLKPPFVMFSALAGHPKLCPTPRLLRLPVGASMWLPSAKVRLFFQISRTNSQKEKLLRLTAIVVTFCRLSQSMSHHGCEAFQ